MASHLTPIYSILADGRLTLEEFATLEKCLFESDGYIDTNEKLMVDYIVTDSSPLSPDALIWATPEVRTRLSILGESRTLDQYLEKLKAKGEVPAAPEDTLQAVSLAEKENSIWVSNVSFRGKNVLVGLSFEGKYKLVLLRRGKEWEDCLEQNISFVDLQDAMNIAARSKRIGKQAKQALKSWNISAHNAEIHQPSGTPKAITSSDPNYSGQIDLNKILGTYLDLHLMDPVSIPSTPPYPIFYGEMPVDNHVQALRKAIQILPPNILALLQKAGVTIHLADYRTIIREATNQDSNAILTNEASRGVTFPGKPIRILLGTDVPAYYLCDTLLHEIGHALLIIAQDQHIGDGKPYETSPYAVMEQHYNQLQMQNYWHVRGSYPSVYAATHFHEWFAEAFTYFYLGKQIQDPQLAGGEGMLGLYKARKKDIKQGDPHGFRWLTLIDQQLSQTTPDLSKCFSWESYTNAGSPKSKNPPEKSWALHDFLQKKWPSKINDADLKGLDFLEAQPGTNHAAASKQIILGRMQAFLENYQNIPKNKRLQVIQDFEQGMRQNPFDRDYYSTLCAIGDKYWNHLYRDELYSAFFTSIAFLIKHYPVDPDFEFLGFNYLLTTNQTWEAVEQYQYFSELNTKQPNGGQHPRTFLTFETMGQYYSGKIEKLPKTLEYLLEYPATNPSQFTDIISRLPKNFWAQLKIESPETWAKLQKKAAEHVAYLKHFPKSPEIQNRELFEEIFEL